jgi:uncharacterized LabA/DUF88 family protein
VSDAKTKRIALFVDGPNLYTTTRALGFDVDYKALLKEFPRRGMLVRAFYYTAVIETVVTRAAPDCFTASAHRKLKGNIHIELAVDAMELAGRVSEMGVVHRRWRFSFAG